MTSISVRRPLAADGGKAPRRVSSSISRRPLSPLIGRACCRTNFIPLYSGGLWLAVTMMPPSNP